VTYTAEFDTVDAGEWHRLLQEFDDASIFQTWIYGAAHWGEGNLSHAVVKKGDKVIGLAQPVLVGMPIFGKILAYVIFGPVYRRRDDNDNVEHLLATISALRDEYTVRRRLCLRIRFWAYDLSSEVLTEILADGGWKETGALYRTYILDLSRPESQLRASMAKTWRANLRKAEQCRLAVSQRSDHDGIRVFLELHRQMRERKHFSSIFTDLLPDLYLKLPDRLKPNLFICWRDRIPVSAAVVCVSGNRAFSLNAATGNAALEARAGYFLQWAIIRWLKETGQCRWYDLFVGNTVPGVRQFKRGLVGARAPEIASSEFEACESRLLALIVGLATRFHQLRHRVKGRLARPRRRWPVLSDLTSRKAASQVRASRSPGE
jgi:hypothetical protein